MASESSLKNDNQGDGGASQASVENLIKSLIERVEDSERRYADALDQLHSRLDRLSAATLEAKSASESDDGKTLDRLHQEVSSLAQKLSSERQPESDESDVFAKLARGSEPFAAPSEDSFLGSPAEDSFLGAPPAEEPKAPYETSRPDSLFSESEAAARDLGMPEYELPSLSAGEDEGFAGRTEETAQSDFGEPAFEHDFSAGTPEPAPAAPMETADYARRLVDAAARLENSLQTIVPNDQIEALNAKMNEIAANLDRALQRGQAEAARPDALQHIETQISDLSQQLGRAETEISKIGGIEEQLSQLISHIDTQPSMEDVAHRAASEAASLVSSEVKASAAERLEAIHKDIVAMNERSTTTDDRLADTLSAVHDSLKKLVEQSERPSPPPAPRRAPFAEPSAPMAAPMAAMAAPEQTPAAAQPAPPPALKPQPQPKAQPESAGRSLRSQLAEILPEDEEDEVPAFGRKGAPMRDPLENKGPELPARYVEADFTATRDEDEADEDGASDSFVAAARRAAQAAAAKSEKEPSGWRERRRNKAAAEDTETVEQPQRRKTRNYLMFFAVILLIVSASLLYSRLKSKPDDTAPAAIEQSEPAPSSSESPGDGATNDDTPGSPADHRGEKSGRLNMPTEIGALQQGGAMPGTNADGPTLAPQPVALKPDDNGLPPGVSLSIFESETPATAAASKAKPDSKKASLPLPPAEAGPLSLRQAAAEGDPKAQYVLGLRYAESETPNMQEAMRWLRLAGTGGLAPAEYRLGVLYERGEGVEFNLDMAQSWYMRAAEKGNLKAMHNLAVIEGGKNGSGDYSGAYNWYAKAAQGGLGDSQFNLAVLLEHGLGTGKNLVGAYKWYALAASQGDAEATKRRNALKAQLSAADLAKAESQIATWRPTLTEREANEVIPDPTWMAEAVLPSKALITKTQSLLNSLGYDAGPVDGAMGERTRSAILDFERKNGLPETGEVSTKLVTRLEKLAS
ncbi:SEL1-like repeat protein [Methyloligella sp. 2.7D]|uniref:SEL1-like repeat protein n=1 Tax=unclassified Methyloligella TaxID=2625955 RepID=UPI00157D357F|nr:SEL1-like repeat protein [Methyloligella sp. GL2]QKP78480.1 SEL1-like repeat protein [Methyloligella sp. GL2]